MDTHTHTHRLAKEASHLPPRGCWTTSFDDLLPLSSSLCKHKDAPSTTMSLYTDTDTPLARLRLDYRPTGQITRMLDGWTSFHSVSLVSFASL